ncbi:MAG: hypothetical protein AB1750_05840, partial [Chloroflexota bacterium]
LEGIIEPSTPEATMQNFLTFLDQNSGGLLVLAGIVIFLILIIQWITWIFGLGRYKKALGAAGSLRDKTAQFVFGEFLAKVINDFRNLLAVMMVLVFALVLVFTIFRSATHEETTSSLQAVMSTLGALVGPIVGYYFGESAAKSAAPAPVSASQAPMQQKPAEGMNEEISEAPAPPPSDGVTINDV